METVTIARLAASDLDAATAEDVYSWIDLSACADARSVAAAADRARRSHRILIGVGRPAEGLKELIDAMSMSIHDGDVDDRRTVSVSSTAEACNELSMAIRQNPMASMTCSQLLRMAEHLDVCGALVAESWAYSTLQSGPEFHRWLAADRPRKGSECTSSVLLNRTNDCLTIELDRPERHNAIDARMRDELVNALDIALCDNTVDGVVLRGRGRSFSSGGDLAEFGTSPDPVTAHVIRVQHRPGEQIHRLAQRLGDRCVADVHGAVVGGGLELAAFAGHVVSDSQSLFRLPEVSMGLIPGAGGTVSVSRRIGRWRAAWLMLTGNTIDAVTAERWHLVDTVHTGSPSM